MGSAWPTSSAANNNFPTNTAKSVMKDTTLKQEPAFSLLLDSIGTPSIWISETAGIPPQTPSLTQYSQSQPPPLSTLSLPSKLLSVPSFSAVQPSTEPQFSSLPQVPAVGLPLGNLHQVNSSDLTQANSKPSTPVMSNNSQEALSHPLHSNTP